MGGVKPLSKTNYILTSDGSFISEDQLLHGRNIGYVDLDPDELMHYKYLYKKKVNGKWRYYYDIGEAGYVDGNNHRSQSPVRGYTWLEDKLGKDERDRANRASAVYNQANKNSNNREYSSSTERNATMNRVSNLGRKAVEANKAYMKTPLGRIETLSNAFKKAKQTVGGWLSKAAKKLGAN